MSIIIRKLITTFIRTILLVLSFLSAPLHSGVTTNRTPAPAVVAKSPTPIHKTTPRPTPRAIQPSPVPLDQRSGPPVRLYAKSFIDVRDCASTSCNIIDTITPASYFEFSYTPKVEWFKINTVDNKTGYIRLSELIKTLPARCSAVMPYDLEYVNDQFISRGFDKPKLLTMIASAKAQWEQALGRDIFKYDPSEKNNTINFTLGDYADIEPNHSGISHPYIFENGAVANFKIAIYAQVFDVFKGYNGSDLATLEYNALYLTILHELGHAIGLGHIPTVGAIMNPGGATGQTIGPNLPALVPEDVVALKSFCAN